MATRIEAIIFDGDPDTAELPMGLRAVPLPGELTMLPVTAEVASGLDPDAIGDERIPGNWNLQQPVAALARALSHDRRVVYFFSETWARNRLLGRARPGTVRRRRVRLPSHADLGLVAQFSPVMVSSSAGK